MHKNITFKNSKGQRLVGVLHIPKGLGPFPAVIVQHGLFANHNKPLIKLISRKLEKSGFMALRFTASGHKPSSGSYEDILASQFIEDIKKGLIFFKKQPQINKYRIGIVGHSLGAYSSLIITSLSREIRSIVSIASFIDVFKQVSILKKRRLYKEYDDYITVWGKKLSKNHYQDRKLWKIEKMIADIHCPLLVIHGAKDQTTKPIDARRIFQIANQPKELKIIKGADHNFCNQKHTQRVVNLTVNWFIKYLKN